MKIPELRLGPTNDLKGVRLAIADTLNRLNQLIRAFNELLESVEAKVSIPGEKGDRGNTGPRGEQGPQGVPGADGLAGPAGPAGPAPVVATTLIQGISKVDNNSAGDPVALTAAGHGAAADPHPQYSTDADLAAHIAAGDPHPVYATDADLAVHIVAGDPHPVYATDADLAAHVAAADPHVQYQKESEKGAVGGYAGLNGGALVPQAQLGTGSAGAGAKFLADDQTYKAVVAAVPVTQVEVDFGAIALCETECVVMDAAITPASRLIVWPSGVAATGLDADEAEFWTGEINAIPEAGQIRFCVRDVAYQPTLQGKKKINYLAA